MNFEELNLAPAIVQAVREHGYETPTPIQAEAIPAVLAGRDLLGGAQTGTGKTAAFTLPMLHRLSVGERAKSKFGGIAIRALVLTPTRELAAQVEESVRVYGKHTSLTSTVVFGGVGMNPQINAMKRGVDILVATPGRLLDLQQQGFLDLSGVQMLVLDEADRMLDMGFFDDIVKVARQCPKERQTLLFSATYPEGIAKLAAQFMRDPVTVTVEAQHAGGQIEQRWYQVKDSERLHAVSQLLLHFRPASTLAFCNTKAQCRDLVAVLQAQGFSALALFGELEQRERDQVLVRFANKSCSVLVATDVAARGLDIASLAAVINVDVTPDAEVHIHRIGRTGRAGESGLALNLASMNEMGSVGKIEQLQGRESEWHELAELVPTGKGPLRPPMVTLHIQGGRKEKIRPGDVLGALTADLGYTREQVGKINVNDWSTYVAVDRAIAEQVASRLNDGRIKGKSVKVRVLTD
ncbi:ATP-dependent RNA helicase DbpA [Hydrogenophaga sp.]|uniref:ATP-dependent RNA helicase DbpA n=1 Tax=Hydrogenophaga sp. TaxID=1904254 RepID=UPI002736BE8A|nr:ATP-dependent RNA helicase DbpA [Hydrogenophaga sp.]MDP3888051.1 ATP-dependent RNA helicase DbpA [Hydrogenophaga sp.]